MSQEVAVFQEAPLAFTAPQETLAAVLEAFSLSLNTGTLSIFDMPKIKVQAAGWEIPTLDGKGKTLPTIEGVITGARTGKIGDGKIFVLDAKEALRVSTGETGVEAC